MSKILVIRGFNKEAVAQQKFYEFRTKLVYRCDKCGLIIDRDLNASINLANVKKYKIV